MPAKTKRVNASLYADWGDYFDSGARRLGIVRCPDGDLEAWANLSSQVLDWAGLDSNTELEPPKWGWWRWNPDQSGTYSQLIGQAKGPGRGNWRGAEVIVKAGML